jgi:hypothetical protein
MDSEQLDEAIEALVRQKCDAHADRIASDNRKAWSFTPQVVTTYIAVMSILVGAAWTFSDFRVTLNDIQARQTNMTERITQVEKRHEEMLMAMQKRIENIDTNGTRQLIGTDAEIRSLKNQVEGIKEALDSVNGAIQQHNESMYDLYRKQNPGKPYPSHHDIVPIPTPRRQMRLDPPAPGPGTNGFAIR